MKVDVTQIEGYDTMTAEEKVAALEGFEIETPRDPEVDNLKNLLSKRNSENASLTKQLREKMTAEEQAKADREAAIKAKDDRIAELEKKEQISSFTNSYIGLGFAPEEAQKQAELLYEGKFNDVMANHKQHIENIQKQAVADAISKNHLSAGEPPTPKVDDKALRKAWGLL